MGVLILSMARNDSHMVLPGAGAAPNETMQYQALHPG